MHWDDADSNAPATRLEVVTIYRPTRVVAAVGCFIVTLLLIISICPNDWLDTINTPGSVIRYKEGLFKVCTASTTDFPLSDELKTCVTQSREYMKGVAALIIIGWILTLAAGCLIVYGMFSQLDDLKAILYKVALILAIITEVLLFIALIVFPVMVTKDFKAMPTEATWSIGWAYMLDWAAFVINIVGIVLLAIDPNPDETSVREKVVNS